MLRYYLGLLELLAELCASRNYIGIKEVVQVYTKDVVFRGLTHNNTTEVGYRLRSRFCRLFFVLFVDCEPQEKDQPLQQAVQPWA